MGGETKTPSHRDYPKYIKEFARSLRKKPTEAENKFWQVLRNNSTGFKFRRQFAIDSKYIADFVCLEKRLIIEIDGGQHNENQKDIERTLYLESENFRVIRFWNNEVLQNLEGCYEMLMAELNSNYTPPPNPEHICSAQQGEGELSPEALAVLNAGRELWKIYFSKTDTHTIREEYKLNRPDVGWYQIRNALKKRNASGDDLPIDFTPFEQAYKTLTEKLQPQVFELGFLRA